MKSLLIVTEAFDIGGLETHIKGEIVSLTKAGCKVHLATGHRFNSLLLPKEVASVTNNLMLEPETLISDFIDTIDKLRKLIRQHAIECIHAHPFVSFLPSFIAAELEKIPFVMTLHGPTSLAGYYGSLYEFLLTSIILPKAGLVVAVSHEVADLVSPYLEQGPAFILPNGVDINTFDLVDVCPEIKNKWLVVSRLDHLKIVGIIDFIKKAHSAGLERVLIVGDGPAKQEFQTQLEYEKLINFVDFYGFSANMPRLMLSAAGVAGMGRVVLEGLASQKPVWLVGYDGVKGLVDHDLFIQASQANFSGRNLKTINEEAFCEQISKLPTLNSIELYEVVNKNFSESVLWSSFLEKLNTISTQTPTLLSDCYRAFLANSVNEDAPVLQSPVFFEQIGKLLVSYKYMQPTLANSYLYYRHRYMDIKLNQLIVESEKQIVSLNQAVVERDGQIVSLNQAVVERDGQIVSLNQAVVERDGQITNLNQVVAERAQVAAKMEELTVELKRMRTELTNTKEILRIIRSSRSWRIMAPFRFIGRLFRWGLLSDDRRWFERKMRSFLHKLPINTFKKNIIKNLYAKAFGRPLLELTAQPIFLTLSEKDARHAPPTTSLECNRGEFLAPEHWEHRYVPYGLLILPIIDWQFRFQRPQQIARRFASTGHPVCYVSLNFQAELAVASLEAGIDGLRLPGHENTNVYQEMPTDVDVDRMVNGLLEYMAASLHRPWVCIVQLPYWGPVAEQLRQLVGCYIIYDCMDDHSGFSTNGETMLAAEDRLLHQADLVVASSKLLFDKICSVNKNTILIRNAVDYAHFATVPETHHAHITDLTIGYYGAVADWFDSVLVNEIARLRPTWQFILIGSTFSADTKPLVTCRNISLLGEKLYIDLPGLIENWDCCIIPFKRVPLTEATNPVKIYEMLAAGKPVVAVGLPELQPIAEAGHIALADTAGQFICEIERKVLQDSKERQDSRRAFALKNTWEVRQQELDTKIRELYPLVSIIIVTYNNLAINRLCLESVFNDTDYPNYEVIVVDNASSDGTLAYLQGLEYPRLRIILNDENLGFSAANNQGLAVASGAYLCLLNNDTVVTGSWLSTLVRHLRTHPRFGLVGPVTNAIGNEAQIPVDYQNLLDMPGWAAAYCQSYRGKLDDISMLAFFCVVMPRSVFDAVGLLDDRFGIGMFEDDDYNRRVRAAGYEVKLARDSYIHHWQRASFKLLGEEAYFEMFYENEKKYKSKWAVQELKEEDARKLTDLIKSSRLAIGTIIFAPSIGWNIHLFQRPHHLAKVLAQDSYIVVFDCSNSQDDVALIKEIEPGLFLFKGDPKLLCELHNPILWTFTYNYSYRDHFPADTIVIYDWIDDLSVFPYDQTMLKQLHERALKESRLVASVALRLHQQALMQRPDAIYLPNAVEEGRFEYPPIPNPALDDKIFARLVSSGKPIAGYYGALAHWFDYELLGQTAKLRPDWHFVLIGPDHDQSIGHSGITRVRNINWLGPRDYQSLPGYLHLFDVALIPFKINDITLATSPLKLFEYFAGGKPVINTPMPECMEFPEIQIVKCPEEFAAALDVAHATGQQPEFRARLKVLAHDNTWRVRARSAMSALESTTRLT